MIVRILTSTLAFLLALTPLLSLQVTQTSTEEWHMLDLPVQLAYCEQDPGNRLQPGGGKYVPEDEMERFDCDAAVGVSVTVYNQDIDFFGRCETGDDGQCRVEAPTDPERELMVAIHMSTVSPGYAPDEAINPTVHYTEFTGIGIPLFTDPDFEDEEIDDLPDRRTLAVKVERDGEPAEVLTQLSEGEVSSEEFPWLATNADGWVSYAIDLFGTDDVDLMLGVDAVPQVACSDIDNGVSLETEWIEGREGDFLRITLPESDGNINCDVTLPQ